jgi:predicted DNA-binding protein
MGTVTQCVRMDERTKAELAALAEATGRSLNYLVRNPGLNLLGLWKG